MEFTESYKATGTCCFSPNSRLLAVPVEHRLVIRSIPSLEVVQLFSCLDKINHIEWAADSEYIICTLYRRSIIQAWSLQQPEWTCKIDEGLAGIAYARWSPDSRHILTVSEFQLRLTVWSLVKTACVHVRWPKYTSKGVSFTHDGMFSAVCTRQDCRDFVILLSCQNWEIICTFPVDTIDLADIGWSPDDSAIVILDSILEFKVLIYSPDGRCLLKYQAYESGLGVKCISWSPSGQSLAVGSYDQMLRILNHLTWKTFAEFMHFSNVRDPHCTVFKEVDEPLQIDVSELCLTGDFTEDAVTQSYSTVRYDVIEVPVQLPYLKPGIDKPNPKQGIGVIGWSHDSRYICARNDSLASALWVWDMQQLELAAILVQKEGVRAAEWDPSSHRLALCTGGHHLYMWTPSGVCCVKVPLQGFSVTDLKWGSDGSCLLLRDKDTNFCCAAVSSFSDE